MASPVLLAMSTPPLPGSGVLLSPYQHLSSRTHLQFSHVCFSISTDPNPCHASIALLGVGVRIALESQIHAGHSLHTYVV